MKKIKFKAKKTWLIVAFTFLVLLFVMYWVLKPVDSYSYSTSGCVGLGTSSHKTERYSVLKGERDKFYQDKKAVPSFQFEFVKALCDSDTETHTLYLF